MEGNYQKQLFSSLHRDVQAGLDPSDSRDSVMVRCMHFCHHLLEPRDRLFDNIELSGFKPSLFHPVTVDLMTANGACGSYSIVLANLLKTFGFNVRIAQMKAGGVFGRHIIVEANDGRGWVVLDPYYDLYFRGPAGNNLASFRDVQANWAFYSAHTPSGYDPSYRYEDVRYTNWQKIPVLMPAFRQLLIFSRGRAFADTFCLRAWVLNVNECIFYILFTISLLILLAWVFRLIKRRSKAPDPVQHPNLMVN